MIVEMRGRSQITIPAEVTKRLGLAEGDKFEIIEKDGGIFLCPVIVCTKNKLNKLAKEIKLLEKAYIEKTKRENGKIVYHLKDFTYRLLYEKV